MQQLHGIQPGAVLLTDRASGFDPVLGGLLGPILDELAARLGSVPGLHADERDAVAVAAAQDLRDTARRLATRVLVLEVNTARVGGRLTAATPAGRWHQWIAAAERPGYWDALDARYPGLSERLRRVLGARAGAAARLAARFAADRDALVALVADPLLTGVSFGSGDSHRGGATVAVVRCRRGTVVYKPRSLAVDAALAGLLAELLPDEPPATRIRVPRVLGRDGYGWAEHVGHRYCTGDAELRTFYRNVGHWLAVVRLLGGSDLHSENMIAAGPVPVVVDCETLFTPQPVGPPSGYGLAVDRAAQLVGGSVLGSGLLPGRGVSLGWRGVDVSAAGALPGQQPAPPVPVLVDAGTDRVRIGLERRPVPTSANHPTPEPMLRRYWEQVQDGFTEFGAGLRERDRAGALAPALARFADLPVRVLLRDSEVYAELARMLWHPVSLHDPGPARARVADLLQQQARTRPEAPADPRIVHREIDDLLDGDIPVFTTTPRAGWGDVPDLVADALRRWRQADPELDRQVIRSALVSAYLNEGWDAEGQRLPARRPRGRPDPADLDRQRRRLAADVVRMLDRAAVRAEDRTVTWIAPVLTPAGWLVQPLNPDGYNGLAGLAVVLAGYAGETRAGRADPVPAVPGLLADALRTLRAGEDQAAIDRAGPERLRPEPPGGYVGLGSRIWTWLLLRRLGVADDGLTRARALAGLVPAGLADDGVHDVLTGAAGVIPPLLALAEVDDDPRWPALAVTAARRLADAARRAGGRASWPSPAFPAGLGGFAHGATGVGWALARLGLAGDRDAARLAAEAFAYEETLWAPELGGWRDLREEGADWAAATWCHGAGGIGVAAADLLRRTGDPRWADVLRRAAAGCWADGMSWNHTLCHGDLGNWETIRLASDQGLGPAGLDRADLDGYVLASVTEFGPVAGLARDAFSPGLLPGVAGMAYQLLRLHPDCPLPSVLLPDAGDG